MIPFNQIRDALADKANAHIELIIDTMKDVNSHLEADIKQSTMQALGRYVKDLRHRAFREFVRDPTREASTFYINLAAREADSIRKLPPIVAKNISRLADSHNKLVSGVLNGTVGSEAQIATAARREAVKKSLSTERRREAGRRLAEHRANQLREKLLDEGEWGSIQRRMSTVDTSEVGRRRKTAPPAESSTAIRAGHLELDDGPVSSAVESEMGRSMFKSAARQVKTIEIDDDSYEITEVPYDESARIRSSMLELNPAKKPNLYSAGWVAKHHIAFGGSAHSGPTGLVGRDIYRFPVWKKKKVALSELTPNGDFDNDDDSMDSEAVRAYAARKSPFPAIIIDEHGDIIDGNHRVAAAVKRGDKTIEAFVPAS